MDGMLLGGWISWLETERERDETPGEKRDEMRLDNAEESENLQTWKDLDTHDNIVDKAYE